MAVTWFFDNTITVMVVVSMMSAFDSEKALTGKKR